MVSFAASLASQIGFLIASLNKNNYKSVAFELSLLTEYGAAGTLILLRSCLEQVNLQEGEVQNLPLKLELLAVVIRHLVHQPNFSTTFCEAVKDVPFSEDLLGDLSKALKLSLFEQISLGLALTDAEDPNWQQEGHNFCKAKIIELYQSPAAGASEAIIDQILLFLYESEGLSKHVPAVVQALSVLQPGAHTSLLLTPLLHKEVNEVDCLRCFDAVSASDSSVPADLMLQLDNAIEVAGVMEELGYSCTCDLTHCNEILSLFQPLNDSSVARIIGMVSRTHTGLDDSQGTYGTFYTALFSSASIDTSWMTTWDVDVLLDSIKELAPGLNWRTVLENLDHEGFYLPDQKAFNLLMSIYGKACQEPFPVEAVCGTVWRNGEGQLSFLRYAVFATPEVLTFARSSSPQLPLEGLHGHELNYGNPNQAWLSVDLLEVLCQLAEMGHASSVRSLLEYPLKNCPETLLLGLVQVKTTWNLIQLEIFASLFPTYLGGGANSSIVLHQLWFLNPEMVLRGMVEVQSKDLSCVPKIIDACQDLKVLHTVLDATPFPFSIELAAFASRKDYLNLEKWLHDNINSHRDAFFQACLKFLRERTIAAEPRNDGSGVASHRSGPISSLPLETTATFFKVLQANPGQLVSRDLVEEMKRLHAAAVRVNPRLLSVGASEQATSESFASDIDEEANSYFRDIYGGQFTNDNVVAMLERFKESPVKREQEIFACMIQSLFDEYRFFPKYPEKELIITAVLFGSLIKRRLVSSLTLGVALRYVLDALRKPLDSKMFSFGLTALEQFMDRLVEWPSYCNHILQITHVRESHGPLVEFIDRVLAHDSVIPSEPSAASTVAPAKQHQNSPGQISSSPSISISEMEASDTLSKSAVTSVTDSQLGQQQQQLQLQHLQQSLHEEKLKNSNVSSVGFLKQPALGQIASSQQPASSNQMFELGNGQKPAQTLQTTTYQQVTSGQSNQAMSSSQSFNRVLGAGALRQTPFTTGFGHALNIETLVAAAERRDIPIEAPSSDVQDKIAFIINNISTANIDMKSREFLEVLKEQYYPWFAQYMVMKRASIEPNFHDVYLKFLDKINSKGLHKEIVKATYENCKVLLRSELIKSSSEERSLLKNLGSWLGKLTIGRNQALRAREIDPKLLITEAYEKGLMIAVIPFTSKILEPCQSSLAYQPPNPWTMGILGLLAEIYALPNLKMNLKFDIEVLFKNLGVDMKDVKPTQLLKGRPREVEGNPDFSNKDLTATHQQPSPVTTDSSSASIATLGQVDLPSEASVIASQSSIPHSAVLSQLVTSGHLSSSLVTAEEEKVPTLAATDRVLSGQGLSQTAPLPSPYSSNQLSMPIPNLSTYVVVNSKLAALGQQLQLSRIVPLAMERAIREIITPVVDRSVTIACMTTRELVTKDYAMEADDNRTRHAANLMVASLAGSLAHVTCKEPLRVAMANHLRNLLQALNVTGEVLEQAVLLVTNDNLDLGCAVIEKAATEKALRDLEEAIGTPLAIRRKQRETMGARFYDATVYSQGNLGRLPEALRPKPGRLSNAQQRVYEDFARLPWQNQPTQTPPVAPAAPIGSSSISVVSGLGSYTPAAAQGALNSYTGIGGPQAALGMGALAPSLDPSSEELDHRIPSPLSLASSTSGLLEGGARQILETGTGLSNFGAVGSGVIEVTNAEATSSLKDGSSMVPPTASPPLPIEQPGITSVEPSLTTGEVLEKYRLIAQKLDEAISESLHTGYTSPSQDQEIQGLILEISDIISQCISRDEAALAVAQKVFKRLYESTSNALHVHTHLAILAAIRDVCKRVVKELTSWVIYSDEERKFNREITVGLIKSELINLTDFNLHLAKLMDGGRNTAATEFAVYLVQTCMVQDAGVSATELYNVIDALGKAAQRPGSPESLQQLVEIAKNTSSIAMGQTGPVSGKDDKVRLAKEKRPTSSRGGALREDSKVASKDSASADPAGLREQVAMLFDDWARVCDASGSNDKGYAVYISQLQHTGLLKGDDVSDRFFRILTELAVTHSLNSESPLPSSVPLAAQQQQQGQPFAAVDAYSKLVVLLVKYYAVDPAMSKINLLNRVFSVTVRVIQRDADEKKTGFHPRPYFRLFVTWLMDFNSPDPALDASNFQVLTAFANAFMQLQPLRVPGWSFAWLELISHRMFMPKLLLSNSQKGWPLVQRLLVALFKFMEPYLRNADLSEPVRLLYKGTLRVLLVLLHDFPEFLCDNHFSFCDVIPPSCIQMRNLILSAFPRNMRLPDPFTPNLKVDLLPEISQSPRILSDVEFAPKNKQLKSEIDDYLKTRQPLSLSLVDLKQRLMLLQHEAASAGTRYNVPLINALVLYVGMQGIQQLQSKTTQQLAVPTAPITHSAPMDIFQRLIIELDTEGRYLFLNAVANQLRYPNNHTHYFSCVLLYLFAEANQEIIQEQITRVLLERLIVNRPHPWGLLITFIELIKNPRYNFWSHGFTRCAPEIEKLFESVARSCMGPPLKPVEDDLGSTMAAEGMKG